MYLNVSLSPSPSPLPLLSLLTALTLTAGPEPLVDTARRDVQEVNDTNIIKGGPLFWYRRVVAG